MLSRSKIENIWFKIIKKITPKDFTLVFAEEILGENRSKICPPFTTLKIISGPNLENGFDENIRCADGKFFLTSFRTFTISLQSFGAGAFDALALLQTSLCDPLCMERLTKDNVAIIDRTGIVDVSALLQTGYEKRFSMDIVFRIAECIESRMEHIEAVEISGKIKDVVNIEIEEEFSIGKE